MEGLLEEGAELIKEKPDQDVLDAGLISAAQHVEHYEMAGYGTARTWARLLGYADHAKLLQQTLDEEGETDKLLTALAERSVNIDAETPRKLPRRGSGPAQLAQAFSGQAPRQDRAPERSLGDVCGCLGNVPLADAHWPLGAVDLGFSST